MKFIKKIAGVAAFGVDLGLTVFPIPVPCRATVNREKRIGPNYR